MKEGRKRRKSNVEEHIGTVDSKLRFKMSGGVGHFDLIVIF